MCTLFALAWSKVDRLSVSLWYIYLYSYICISCCMLQASPWQQPGNLTAPDVIASIHSMPMSYMALTRLGRFTASVILFVCHTLSNTPVRLFGCDPERPEHRAQPLRCLE